MWETTEMERHQHVAKRNTTDRHKSETLTLPGASWKTERTRADVGTEKNKMIGKQIDGETEWRTGPAKEQRDRFTGMVNGQHANQACMRLRAGWEAGVRDAFTGSHLPAFSSHQYQRRLMRGLVRRAGRGQRGLRGGNGQVSEKPQNGNKEDAGNDPRGIPEWCWCWRGCEFCTAKNGH